MDSALSEEERGIRDRVRDVVDRDITPVMPDYWDRAEFPFELPPYWENSASWVAPSTATTAPD